MRDSMTTKNCCQACRKRAAPKSLFTPFMVHGRLSVRGLGLAQRRQGAKINFVNENTR